MSLRSVAVFILLPISLFFFRCGIPFPEEDRDRVQYSSPFDKEKEVIEECRKAVNIMEQGAYPLGWY